MATRTVTIYASTSIFIEKKNPDKNDLTRAEISAGQFAYGYELFVPPAGVFGKRAISAKLYVHAKSGGYDGGRDGNVGLSDNDMYPIEYRYEPSTVTWNRQIPIYYAPLPDGKWFGTGFDFNLEGSEGYQWQEFSMEVNDKRKDTPAYIAAYGIRIGGDVWTNLTYHTANSNFKPYLVLTFADDECGIYAEDIFPNGKFVDNHKEVQLNWYFAIKPHTIGRPIEVSGVENWSFDGKHFSLPIPDSTGYWAPPIPNPETQLPEQGTVTWSVTITDTAGNVNTSKTATFYTTDSTLYAYPISPINAYIDGTKSVDLNWRWSISTGTRPTRADFQVSDDGGTTWDDLGTVTNQNDLTYHTAPNELPAGNILWRVRGYNTDSVAGPWSTAAAVVVRRSPNTPAISGVTGNPKPAVTWQAEGQQAYQLQIGPWDSGTVFGTEKTDQCPEFLLDGPAAVRLRVQNSFGMWSAWAETSVTIQNRPGAAITARARAHRADIRLTWETQGEYPEYLIYRDGELVGVAAGLEYTDHAAIGKATYTVRGVNYDSTYTDSPPVTEILSIRSGLIAREGEWKWLLLDRRVGSRPARSGGEEADVTYTAYSGRALPVAELSGHRQRSHSYTYSLPTMGEVRRLAAMSGHRVVYKHKSGERAAGILGGVSWAWNRLRWDVSFTITEVDHGPIL